ncbi:hypothetical protein SAMN05216378_3168 [Paenibacillus catalpae]|uniref:Uncharacterized protein n=1 Tax=Paenibacillus catalpae TaxID=1045775 RepID=A0A1I2AMT9_9BACL|nr:hypothetical protein SAMN05216378_3168 [Paenibacillus catalpae]
MKIGCLHAHYSNIEYIQAAIGSKAELIHFVDPGLMNRIMVDTSFDLTKAKAKVIEQLEWIAQSGVDVILITCTNYIALLEEIEISIPIIKIDEPFFNELCQITQPQILLFTNPATVEGTMKRLNNAAASRGQQPPDIEARIIEHTFDLIMEGHKTRYTEEVCKYIHNLLQSEPDKKIAVAQLSMVEAAERAAHERGAAIGNPLESLIILFSGEDIYYTGNHLHVGNWDKEHSPHNHEEGIAWERVDGTMDLYYLDPDVEDFRGVYICNVKSNEEADERFRKWVINKK